MGGRGASSGVSEKSKKKYGTEYKTVLKESNIKFVKQTDNGSTKTPMETMTKGRVYVTVNSKEELKSITYYDDEGKRTKQIDLTHQHNGKGIHAHYGYYHDEGGTIGLTAKEKQMVDFVSKLWYNKNGK